MMLGELESLKASLRAKRAALMDPKPDTDHLGHWKPAVLQNRKKRAAIDAALHRVDISLHEQTGGPLPDGCSDRECAFCASRKIYRNPFALLDEQFNQAKANLTERLNQ
jgi:hypothetical protein